MDIGSSMVSITPKKHTSSPNQFLEIHFPVPEKSGTPCIQKKMNMPSFIL